MRYRNRASAFTLVELLVVIAIIGILIALLLPAVQAAREAARRSQCTNNLKQLMLGAHNYHDTYKAFPYLRMPARHRDGAGSYTRTELSGFISLLPFIEQQPLYEQILATSPPYGPVGPWESWGPWDQRISAFQCPSDGNFAQASGRGPRNYNFSIGDSIYHNYELHANSTKRGLFVVYMSRSMANVKDGTSNTVALSERAIGLDNERYIRGNVANSVALGYPSSPAPCLATMGTAGQYASAATVHTGVGSGRRWAHGRPFFSAFSTVLPPNAPSCTENGEDSSAVYSATSYHPGGVNAALTDGSVRFISETIDAGSATNPEAASGPSPFGVWGALGSIRGGEPVSDF